MDSLAVGLTGILRSTVTVDDSAFQCLDTQIRFHICFHCQTEDAKIKAVLDRLLYHAQVIFVKGPSYRLKKKPSFMEFGRIEIKIVSSMFKNAQKKSDFRL